MVSPKYFQLVVTRDEHGPVIFVTHRVTGQRIEGRPVVGESVRAASNRLIDAVRRTFFDRAEYQLGSGPCVAGPGKVGLYRWTHLPSGRFRQVGPMDCTPLPLSAADPLLDELVEEVWTATLANATAGVPKAEGG
jgi:hypothetical protein